MVVLLIMAILLAIAIPTFLGVSGSANDRAAQSNLNTALTNAKSYFQSNSQSFAAATTAIGVCRPRSQHPVDDRASGTSSQISVYTDATTGNGVILASLSKTGVCWYLVDNEATKRPPRTPPTRTSRLPSSSLEPGTAGAQHDQDHLHGRLPGDCAYRLGLEPCGHRRIPGWASLSR